MVKKFADPGELAEWLAENGIDVGTWGTGPYKSIANLWDEYEAGEVFFEDSPPMRIVQVVQVFIQQNGVILLEVEQEFTNGKRRFRNQPPAEKIKRHESGVDAAYRCLKEELGISRDQIAALNVENEPEVKLADSPSYPSLATRFTIHKIMARVTGLPKEDFWRDNRAAAEGDPVGRHKWGWREQR